MDRDQIISSESEIDHTFSENNLRKLEFSQAAWTLLSVAEDLHLINSQIRPLPEKQLDAFVDTLINSLTYPLRACFNLCERNRGKVNIKYVERDYADARAWLDASVSYRYFCSMFSLWHKGKIKLKIEGKSITTIDWNTEKFEYEAYNRLIRKAGDVPIQVVNLGEIAEIILQHSYTKNQEFNVVFNPKLVEAVVSFFKDRYPKRFFLPDGWQFTNFTVEQFKSVFQTIAALLMARHIARVIFSSRGLVGLGYTSSVWLIQQDDLVARLSRYTGIPRTTIACIVKALIFGNNNIRHPDIALQPIVDLGKTLALSPFVWTNVDAERNLCALLNQITSEKTIYATLISAKETLLREELIQLAHSLGYETRYGKIKNTDVDFALISRAENACLTIELKWFIEPAEIREVIDRSKELRKGVIQAKKISTEFKNKSEELINRILTIDSNYHFLAIVGTKNWIGHDEVQDVDIPIIKVGHLMSYIKEHRSLEKTIAWLKNRAYLPTRGQAFEIRFFDINCGEWESKWYGIEPLIGQYREKPEC